jgi:hypothetical protein
MVEAQDANDKPSDAVGDTVGIFEVGLWIPEAHLKLDKLSERAAVTGASHGCVEHKIFLPYICTVGCKKFAYSTNLVSQHQTQIGISSPTLFNI